jgi:hypothetical protein
MPFCEIEKLISLKELADKTRMIRILLEGQAFSYPELYLSGKLVAEVSELPDNDLIEQVLRDIVLEYIPKYSIRLKNVISGKQRFNIWLLLRQNNL